MTKHEKIVVSAYTGVLMCDFDDLHKYIQEKLGRRSRKSLRETSLPSVSMMMAI